jgi:5-(carboxyamino)imidazole ribonucleotide synthase
MTKSTFPYPLSRIGIIGGGQLGRMTAQQAKRMGFYVTVLDPWPNCPANHIADKQIVGDLYDSEKLRQLAEASDVLTYDVEHIDVQTLKTLEMEGYIIHPSPNLLETIQDKLKQKQVLAQHNVPIPRYEAIDTITADYLASAQFPIVQKTRFGGYDGKGVVVLNSPADLTRALTGASIIEEFIDLKKELAVMVARTQQGETVCYPVVEMVFDNQTNICDIVFAPARISPSMATQAQQIALQAVTALEGVGIFGVEMFLTQDEQVLVNEIAPRPHNSGHYTIEACITCQFEQLIRAVSGLPLGDTTLLRPVAMLNLLGAEDMIGTPLIEGLSEALAIPGLTFHFYGKEITKPFRKMGHVTVLDEQLDKAIEKIHQVKKILKIVARK